MSDTKSKESGVNAGSAKGAEAHHSTDSKQVVDVQSVDRGLNKHPLNRPWTLWYDSVSTYDSQRWEHSLVEVMTVRTVEDFFTMLHYCKPPHVLRVSAQYHFFREGVKPMWEDPSNKGGGKLWLSFDGKTFGGVTVGKKLDTANTNGTVAGDGNNNNSTSSNDKPKKEERDVEKSPEMNTIWENVLMAMVGEYLDDEVGGEHIMGVVLSKRKYQNRLALWLRDATATEAIGRIERQLVKELGLPSRVRFIFTPHVSGKS
ncbi:Translation Initiation factor eIF- 4e [Trypanosoma melophagium]|uniref:Translation Initiation factor eIF- 4e n=1 Tax=Trypanosoma melophagium TaxID=715481 RepID=UPI00351A3744|nr:Translation Initiation factor eIF- 4e [Trypanosoma melophagium]